MRRVADQEGGHQAPVGIGAFAAGGGQQSVETGMRHQLGGGRRPYPRNRRVGVNDCDLAAVDGHHFQLAHACSCPSVRRLPLGPLIHRPPSGR